MFKAGDAGARGAFDAAGVLKKQSFNTIFDWADDLLGFLKTFFAFTVEDDNLLAFAVGTSTIDRIYERFMELLPPDMSPAPIETGLDAEFDPPLSRIQISRTP